MDNRKYSYNFLRVESDSSQHMINVGILHLSVMFEYGLLGEDKRFPSVPIILSFKHGLTTFNKLMDSSFESIKERNKPISFFH